VTSKIANAGRGRFSRSLFIPTTGQAATVAMMVLAAYIVLEFAWPNHAFANVVDMVIFPALGLVYVPLAFLVATKARGRLRAAWWAVAIGLTCWAVGEMILAYYTLKAAKCPSPPRRTSPTCFTCPL
jgi:hypothetical protein